MARVFLLALCLGIVADAYAFDGKYLRSTISVMQKVTTAFGREVVRIGDSVR